MRKLFIGVVLGLLGLGALPAAAQPLPELKWGHQVGWDRRGYYPPPPVYYVPLPRPRYYAPPPPRVFYGPPPVVYYPPPRHWHRPRHWHGPRYRHW